MARRQVDQLDTPAVEERVAIDEEGVRLARAPELRRPHRSRGWYWRGEPEFAAPWHAQPASASLSRILGDQRNTWVDQHGHASGLGYAAPAAAPVVWPQFCIEKIDSCQVAARPGEAGDKTKSYRVFADAEDNGDRCSCRFGRERSEAAPERRSRPPVGGPGQP